VTDLYLDEPSEHVPPTLGRRPRIAVVFYSATGNVHAMAHALAEGAMESDTEVRILRVPETAPHTAVAANPSWQAYVDSVEVPEVTLADLEWADGLAFGTPARFGGPSSQLKSVIDSCGGLWARGVLIDKVATCFTSASTPHGGLESTLLALNNAFYHWGAIVLPLGYTAPVVHEHGNPYGSSWVSRDSAPPDTLALDVCRQQGRRLAKVTRAVAGGLGVLSER
jgi:NAD(P)H dehydrogenase (quinone)